MKVLPIQNLNNRNNSQVTKKQFATNVVMPQNNTISNVFYMPVSPLNFKGLSLETKVIQKVLGKQFQGLGIYTPDKRFIDFLKIATGTIEPIDIVKATPDEITARLFSKALKEAYAEGSEAGTDWISRYNPENMDSPVAVSHTLCDIETKEEIYAKNLEILFNPRRCKSLDIPITDANGRLNIDAVVFDTETTGVNTNVDKIIQMGALKIKNGKIVKGEGGMFNQLINPEIPIPDEASDVNHITDDMVAKAPTIDKILNDFLGKFMNKESGVIVAYNGLKFDVPILNRAIREHNIFASTDLKEKQSCKVLDPYVLIQRIHPFVGAKKKLSYLYDLFFGKPMENAHDAFADVQGTVDMLKYCLYWLSEHRKDKTVPLTLREVLLFQNGAHKVENIDVPLHPVLNFNNLVKFEQSYRSEPLDVTNYFQGYKLTRKILDSMADEIGAVNVEKLKTSRVVDEMIGTTYKGHPLQAAEMEKVPKSSKFKTLNYTLRENFIKNLGFANLEPYNGKSKGEIENFITDNSKKYLKEKIKEIWFKNVDPKDIVKGNDLPDIEIARRVMREAQEE